MRNRKIILILTTALLGLSACEFEKENTQAQSENNQQMFDRPMGKIQAIAHVDIVAASEIPEKDDEEVTLRARVVVNRATQSDGLYTWTLPEGVRVTKGSITGSQKLVPGKKQEIELRVIGFSKEQQNKIVFEIKFAEGQSFLSQTSIIVSRPEDTLEYVAADLKKSAEEQFKEQDKNKEVTPEPKEGSKAE